MPQPALPTPEPTPEAEYPPWVTEPEDRERWDVARGLALQMFGGDGPNAWQATRAIYQSAIPTRVEGDPS